MNGSGLTASDVMALGNREDNTDILIILFFLVFFGGMGGGMNTYQVPATKDFVSGEFNNQNVMNKLDVMSTGLGNATWNINNEIHGLGKELAECCCTTQRAIDRVAYENSKNTCDIINSAHQDTQRVIDTINNYAMEQKNVKINEQGQLLSEQRIVNTINASLQPPRPVPAYQVANPYCGYNPCSGNPCGGLYA